MKLFVIGLRACSVIIGGHAFGAGCCIAACAVDDILNMTCAVELGDAHLLHFDLWAVGHFEGISFIHVAVGSRENGIGTEADAVVFFHRIGYFEGGIAVDPTVLAAPFTLCGRIVGRHNKSADNAKRRCLDIK